MGRRGRVLAFLACGTTLGCGSDGASSGHRGDASLLGFDVAFQTSGLDRSFMPDPPAPPALPTPPTEPSPPRFTPCPSGWIEVDGDPPHCSPFQAAPDISACARESEALFPGEPGCQLVGTECPAGLYPEGLPATDVRYASADAPGGGDGSAGSPMTLAEALAGAPPGTTVALSRGTYTLTDTLFLPDGITVRGACPAETALTAVGPFMTVTARAGAATLENLRLEGSQRLADTEGAGAALTLSHVVLLGTAAGTTAMAAANGASLSGDRVATWSATPDAPFAISLLCTGGATCNLSHLSLERGTFTAIATFDEGAARIADAAVWPAPPPLSNTDSGTCASAARGGTLTLLRSRLASCRLAGLTVTDTDASAALEDVVFEDVGEGTEDASGAVGLGILVTGRGTSLSLRRVRVERVHAAGLAVLGPGASMDAEDVQIGDVALDLPTGTEGRGIVVQGSATGTLRRVQIEDTYRNGLAVGVGSTLEADDLRVRRTRDADRPESDYGVSVVAALDSELTLRRVAVFDSALGGIAAQADTVAILEDVSICATRRGEHPNPAARLFALAADMESTLVADRVALSDNRGQGLVVAGASSMVVRDLAIRAQGLDEIEEVGDAVQVSGGDSELVLTRALLQGLTGRGLVTVEGRTTLRDVTIRNVDAGDTLDRTRGLAIAIGSAGSSTFVDAERVEIDRAQGAALVVDLSGAEAFFTDVRITNTRPAPSQVAGYGIQVSEGARALFERLVVEGSTEAAVLAWHEGTTLDVRNARAASSHASPRGGGVGMGSYAGASLSVDGFVLEGHALAAIQLALDGNATFNRGLVFGNPVGLNLQTDANPADVLGDVRLFDNGVDLDSNELFVPDL